MTRISTIQGIPANEMLQRGQAQPGSGYVPFNNLTRGEFRLHLLSKELRALKAMYPELSPLITRAMSLIDNAIWKGLHNGGSKVAAVGALHDPLLQKVAKAIHNFAERRWATPTTGSFIERSKITHIADAIIPARDCTPPPDHGQYGNFETPAQYQAYYNTVVNPSCKPQKDFEALANKHLETASPHLLYEYVSEVVNPNLAPTIVGVKYVFHQGAITEIAKVGRVWQRSDLREWVRLGVKLSCSKQGMGMLPPKEAIEGLRANSTQPGIGVIELIALIKVLVTAIAALTAMITAINASKRGNDEAAIRLVQLQYKGLGTDSTSPNTQDWNINPGESNGGGGGTDTPPPSSGGGGSSAFGNNTTPLLLAGAAALLLTR